MPPQDQDHIPADEDRRAMLKVLWAFRNSEDRSASKKELRGVLARLEDPAMTPDDPESLGRQRRRLDKKVERCIRKLEEVGGQVTRTPGDTAREVRYTLVQGPTGYSEITAESRLALHLATMAIAPGGTLLWNRNLEAIGEIVGTLMSERDRQRYDRLKEKVRVQGGIDPEDLIEDDDPEMVLMPLLDALADGRKVDLMYQRPGTSRPFKLSVAPFRLTHDLLAGGAYLLAWDKRGNRPKQYRLSRIHSAQASPEEAGIAGPRRMDLADRHQVGGWVDDAEASTVVALIHGKNWVKALEEAPPDLPGWSCIRQDGRPDLAILKFKANQKEGTLRWLLQFGASLHVLEPAFLVEAMQEELQRALGRYRTTKG